MGTTKSKKVLISGGSGFIGSYLTQNLINKGHSVRIVDLVSPKKTFSELEYIQGDVRDPKVVEKAIQGVDAVYHFAAIVSVPLCQQMPVESYRTNVFSTLLFLEQIREQDQKFGKKIQFFFASSSSVYGQLGKENVPISEVATDLPISFYGAQKLASEHLIYNYNKDFGLQALPFRFFNAYGVGQDMKSPYSGVISVFLNSIFQSKPMFLNDGGFQTRDFISVVDIAEGCSRALEISDSSVYGKPLNLGIGKSVKVSELAATINTLASRFGLKPVPVQNVAARAGDVSFSRADIERARKVLGWSPSLTLEDGLAPLFQECLKQNG